jgi:threonylcarbamoyladenosine tRNA methylthiotransferase MtaB
MENILASRGHMLVRAGEGCDACIINTCTVTAVSAGKSRKAVRRLKKLEPGALIAVCGCLSQLMPDEIASIGADIIGGSGDRREFVLKLEELYKGSRNGNIEQNNRTITSSCSEIHISDPKGRKTIEELPCGVVAVEQYKPATPSSPSSPTLPTLPTQPSQQTQQTQPTSPAPRSSTSTRTRALLKIQDGCDNYCSYCVIPYARGRSRSLPLDSIADQAGLLREQGFREIVITGIEISAYGKDLSKKLSLIDALRIASGAASDVRIRVGSLDPSIITDEFCEELRSIPNLCDHFHLSVQSGCDDTLNRMGRKYSTDDVMGAISALRRLYQNCGITADLITGFPGESDAEFEKTQLFIRQAAFSDMHIFPCSERPGTLAAKMPNQIGKGVKVRRARLSSEIQAEISQAFRLSQVGKTLEVLFERKHDGYWSGYSTNYLQVAVKAEKSMAKNSIERILIESAEKGVLSGRGELREES